MVDCFNEALLQRAVWAWFLFPGLAPWAFMNSFFKGWMHDYNNTLIKSTLKWNMGDLI